MAATSAAASAAAMPDAAADADDVIAQSHGPSLAVAAASQVEDTRITLFRACASLQHMLALRGYGVTRAGETSFDAPLPPEHADVTGALSVFRAHERAADAESSSEVLIEAEMPAAPPAETTAAAVVTAETPASARRVTVFVLCNGKVETIRSVQEHLNSEQRGVGIILTRGALTSYARTYLASHTGPACTPHIQHFLLEDLQGCIAKHCLVPRHVPLTPAEVARVRTRFGAGKLPQLQTTDPMVRFLGLQHGHMVSVWETYGREQPVQTIFEVV
jgi:DNA-directed RNA polymerase subunit H (RpoH/RPB5)